MYKDKLLVGIVAFTLLLLAGVALLASRSLSSGVNPSTEAKAVLGTKTYNWGDIPIDAGNVEATFDIKNEGSGVLELSNIVTSCMCTTALLDLNGETSPEFGMHTKSPYVMKVSPGESAHLKVIFDPAFHGPNGVGPITRQVTVETNDIENQKLNFVLTANVTR